MKKFLSEARKQNWKTEIMTPEQLAVLKKLYDSNGFLPTPKEYATAYEKQLKSK